MLALTNHKSMKEKLTRSQERVLHLLQHHDRAVSAQDTQLIDIISIASIAASLYLSTLAPSMIWVIN